MKQKTKVRLIEFFSVVVVLTLFVVLKLFATDSIVKANDSIVLLLANGNNYTDTGTMIIGGYEYLLRGICDFYLSLFDNQIGVMGYLELGIQIITILLLAGFVRMMIGSFGGFVTLVCSIFLCLPTSPLEYFILMIVSVQLFIFARLHTWFFTNSASKATTVICSIIYGITSCIHACIAPYGIYLAFVLIIGGVLIVGRFRWTHLGVSLFSYIVCNYMFKGYSIATYEEWLTSNISVFINALLMESIIEVLLILTVIILVGVGAYLTGDKKLAILMEILVFAQLLNAIYHNFTMQGIVVTVAFLIVMLSNLLENVMVKYQASRLIKKTHYTTDIIEKEPVFKKNVEERGEMKGMSMNEGISEELQNEQAVISDKPLEEVMVMEDDVVDTITPDMKNHEMLLQEVNMTLASCSESGESEEAESNNDDIPKTDENLHKEIQFLENPLPVPKKHVSTTMDFAIDLTPATCEFDLNDFDMLSDFDI
ncbi:MAG: hypothetical protein R3Y67_08275 [Eubacteriales bacterium]